jgi:hypothetical protein
MKGKIFTHFLKPLFLLLIILLIGEAGRGQTIVGFTLAANGTATSGLAANLGCTVGINGITSSSFSGTNGQTCYGWNAVGSDSWTTSAFTTAGYIRVAVSGQMKSSAFNASSGGPKDFKAQYSLNGSTWTDVPDDPNYSDDHPAFVLTTSLASFFFRLPQICENKATVYVKWVQSSTLGLTTTAGVYGSIGTTSSYNSSLKGVNIMGDAFASPTAQASTISIISVTPTTINIGCTRGNGTNRIIKVNTTNSFTDPVNDYNPTANSSYGGSGEQVVYKGTGSSVVITVPSSTNIYWFRVYDYNLMDALTRYNITTADQNPKQCALETIHSPTYTNIRLINATLGATITTPLRGTVSERGIFWSPNPGVDETSNLENELSSQGGIYTILAAGVDRGTTIYFKGFVTNESGTIMSAESSFSNIPVFTGTGNWGTAARWNVQEVPGANGDPTYGDAADNPVINGICTLTADNIVTDLTINSGKILNINPAIGLTVNGTLTNNGGTAGLKLLSTAAGTGSLMHNTDNVPATVQRYISGTSSLLAKKYHLVSVPVTDETYLSNVWLDSYLFTYVEMDNSWYMWDSPTNNILQTKEGAMVFYPNWSGTTSKTYSITGQLNNDTYSPTITRSGNGYNLVPNPYPSAMDWDLVGKATVDDAIWIFNPESTNYETYAGGIPSGSVDNIIPVGQAFFVKANSPGLSFNNTVRTLNTKSFLKSTKEIANVLHLAVSSDSARDGIAVRFADDATTGHDRKYDAVKFYGSLYSPQLSSTNGDEELSINALPNSEGSTVVPLKLAMDHSGILTFTASGMESFNNVTSIELEDKQLSQMLDLRTNPLYQFTHTTQDAADRFALHFGTVLGIDNPVIAKLSKVIVSDHNIYMEYPESQKNNLFASVYDIQGKLINQIQLSNSGHDHLSISNDGIFILKMNLPTGSETHKIIVY